MNLKGVIGTRFRMDKHSVLLLLIMVTGAILRLMALTTHSMWWDELQSVITANPIHNFADIDAICQKSGDPAPRSFYYALNIWYKIVGYNDFSARLFVSLFGIAAILVIYHLGKTLFSKNTGLLAAFITSINYLIYFTRLK